MRDGLELALARPHQTASSIYGTAMDLGWDSVDWTCEWIQKVGDQKL